MAGPGGPTLRYLLVILLLLVPATAHADGERYEPSVRSPRYAVERWRPLVERYDWSPDVALAVIACESDGDPAIPNRQGSGALGLMQLMPMWRDLAVATTGSDDFTDPEINVATGYALYRAFGGWSPWLSSSSCWNR